MASFAASYVFPAVEHGVVKPRLKMQQVHAPARRDTTGRLAGQRNSLCVDY